MDNNVKGLRKHQKTINYTNENVNWWCCLCGSWSHSPLFIYFNFLMQLRRNTRLRRRYARMQKEVEAVTQRLCVHAHNCRNDNDALIAIRRRLSLRPPVLKNRKYFLVVRERCCLQLWLHACFVALKKIHAYLIDDE